jgi:hypothetical protein
MSGAIGLTPAGMKLDCFLYEMDPAYKGKVYRFITKFTDRIHILRTAVASMEYKDQEYFLKLCRNDYHRKAEEKLCDIDEYPRSLIRNYIHTLSKVDFKPSTRTQIQLREM